MSGLPDDAAAWIEGTLGVELTDWQRQHLAALYREHPVAAASADLDDYELPHPPQPPPSRVELAPTRSRWVWRIDLHNCRRPHSCDSWYIVGGKGRATRLARRALQGHHEEIERRAEIRRRTLILRADDVSPRPDRPGDLGRER